MRSRIAALACAVAAIVARGAPRQELPGVPVPVWMDTESSVCVSVTNGIPSQAEFGFDFSFFATPSNNVTVAAGVDADGDGDLSFSETYVVMGWDCGRYFLDRPRSGPRYESKYYGGAGERSMSYSCIMPGLGNGITSFTVSTSDGRLSGWDSAYASRAWSPSWNMLRVTRRGLFLADGPSAGFTLRQQGAFLQLH